MRAWARALALLAPLASACGAPKESLEVSVEASGCEAVRARGTCVAGTDPVRVRALAPPGALVRVACDAPSAPTLARGGAGEALTLGDVGRCGALVVEVEHRGAFGRARVPLGAASPGRRAVDEATRLRAQAKLDEASALLVPLLRSADLPARAAATSLEARIALARGRLDDAERGLRDAMQLHAQADETSAEAHDAFALSFALLHAGKIDAARDVLDAIAPRLAGYPDGQAELPYYRSLIAAEVSDLRTALREADAAMSRARSLGLDELERRMKPHVADVLQRLGDDRGGRALFEESVRAAPEGSCAEARVRANFGWFLLVQAERGDAQAALDAVEHLARASARFASCGAQLDGALVRLNLALAQLEAGDVGDAAKTRAGLGGAPSGRERPWRVALDAAIAIEEGRPRDALALADELSAHATGLPALGLRAELLRARALERTRDAQAAEAAYARAERLVDALVRAAPLTRGRAEIASASDTATRARLSLLVERRALDQAADAARRSRGRVLASLRWLEREGSLAPEARTRFESDLATYRALRDEASAEQASTWELSTDELASAHERAAVRDRAMEQLLDHALAELGPGAPATLRPPDPGELFLVMHPGRSGWLVLAQDPAGTSAALLAELPDPGANPRAIADALLVPFADRLARATHVRVLPYGASRRIDVHALPFGGRPLGALKIVSYGVDAPSARAGTHQGTALVVSDPTGDLASARAEGLAAARSAMAITSDVTHLTGTATTRASVLAALARASSLHWAGHGAFVEGNAWDSALPLAGGQRLLAADVLAAPRVPRDVVLTGCETGRIAGAGADALGLAQAFVLAGAAHVVAATRPVDDALAARFADALHDGETDLALAYRKAIARSWAETEGGAPSDWATFRLFVP